MDYSKLVFAAMKAGDEIGCPDFPAYKVLSHEINDNAIRAKCRCSDSCGWVEHFSCEDIVADSKEWTVNGRPLVLLKEKKITGFAKFMKETS